MAESWHGCDGAVYDGGWRNLPAEHAGSPVSNCGRFPIVFGRTSVGQEVSWVALTVTLIPAVGLFREARR